VCVRVFHLTLNVDVLTSFRLDRFRILGLIIFSTKFKNIFNFILIYNESGNKHDTDLVEMAS